MYFEDIFMKKLITLTLLLSTLVACGDDKAKTDVKADTTAETKLPASCQEYTEAVEKLIAKSPDTAKMFEEALAKSKEQWKTLTDEQAKAADATCKQALTQIKPLL